MAELTDKQRRFCEEYVADFNGCQAAIRAGYSKNSAKEQASRLLTNDNVSEYVKKLIDELSDKTKLNHEWVLKRFRDISDRCMQAVPVMEFDSVNKVMVQSTDEDGKGIWEFDSSGANKSTEMIGKHLGFFEKDNEQSRPITSPVINVSPKRG